MTRLPAPFLAVSAVIGAVFLIYWSTSASIVATWARSETYKHGFIVVPTVLWLVWRARDRLARVSVRPWWPALGAVAVAGFLWLVGELANALSPTQWAMVAMVPAIVLALFGWQWVRVLAFPLGFLFFAVPFGEAFVPTLIDWTADFTVAALKLSGIPVYREGTHFVIPSGRWSVVEACSGIRYLIASIVVGTLYAWSMYRSAPRRIAFIAASAVVPLVANWLRAYLIVMLGHLSDNRIAAGVDHLIYGWFFFGAVIAAMFFIGARWREDGAVESAALAPPHPASPDGGVVGRRRTQPSVPLVAGSAVLVGVWPFVLAILLARGDTRPVEPAPMPASAGWAQVAGSTVDWRPLLEGPSVTRNASYRNGDAEVGVFVAYYRNQRQGSELVNSLNRIVAEDDKIWTQIARGSTGTAIDGKAFEVRTATLRRGEQRLRIWQTYWFDGRFSASDTRGKLSLAFNRLTGRSDTSAWIALYTVAETDAEGDRRLDRFVGEVGPALRSALAATAAR